MNEWTLSRRSEFWGFGVRVLGFPLSQTFFAFGYLFLHHFLDSFFPFLFFFFFFFFFFSLG